MIILGTSSNSAAAGRRPGPSPSTAFRCTATRDDGGGLVLRPRCSHCCFLVSAPEKGGMPRANREREPYILQLLIVAAAAAAADSIYVEYETIKYLRITLNGKPREPLRSNKIGSPGHSERAETSAAFASRGGVGARAPRGG